MVVSGKRAGYFIGTLVVLGVCFMAWRAYESPISNGARISAEGPTTERVVWAIEGMDCMMCAAGLQNELRAIPGVASATISYQDKSATIDFDPSQADSEILSAAIAKGGFKIVR